MHKSMILFAETSERRLVNTLLPVAPSSSRESTQSRKFSSLRNGSASKSHVQAALKCTSDLMKEGIYPEGVNSSKQIITTYPQVSILSLFFLLTALDRLTGGYGEAQGAYGKR
jgi:hypothetical protein